MGLWDLVRAFFVNAGPGGVFAMSIFTLALVIYVSLTRWILAGGKDES
jgi:hypothetical protein